MSNKNKQPALKPIVNDLTKKKVVNTDLLQVEQPQVEQPQVEQPQVEQPQVEQPQVEQPQVEQPQVEQPQVEQPQVEQPQKQGFFSRIIQSVLGVKSETLVSLKPTEQTHIISLQTQLNNAKAHNKPSIVICKEILSQGIKPEKQGFIRLQLGQQGNITCNRGSGAKVDFWIDLKKDGFVYVLGKKDTTIQGITADPVFCGSSSTATWSKCLVESDLQLIINYVNNMI